MIKSFELPCSSEVRKIQFVIHARELRVISFLIPSLPMCSNAPLELIFRDVRDQPPFRLENSYYVSFIDDYSKFTWVYLIKRNYDDFQVSATFKTLLNTNLIGKSLLCKQIEVVNMKNSIHSSKRLE